MHNQFLLAALSQAWHGRGMCAPNPAVGAVAVQNGKVIAQAFHHGAGTPHAEQLLLDQFPPYTPDVTIYVTLEPCNHWGKTPPCVNAIIEHGISRVIFAYRDPNPIVAQNDTSARLKQYGIDVIFHPLPEINQFYQSYRHWTRTHTPWVTVKMAQTFDGKIAGPYGARIHLSNGLCDALTHQLRYHTDIILTTARTVLMDSPQLNARLPEGTHAKPIAILDAKLALNESSSIFHTAKHCHIFHDQNVPVSLRQVNCTYHATPMHAEYLDLSFVLKRLGSLGYHDVWVEAGATIFRELHQNKYVNQTYLYLVPKILGANALSLCQDADIFQQAHTIEWHAKGDNMVALLHWQEQTCLQE